MVFNKKTLLKPVCTPSSASKSKAASNSASSTKMRVYIRVRPTNEREGPEPRNIIKLVDDRMLVFDPRENDQPFFFHGVKQRMRDITKKQNKEIQFIFDRVYGPSDTNANVYDGSICNIFSALLEGYNCSVFVYGATGAGKTFTMLGNDCAPGIIFLTMRSLYAEIEKLEDRHFDIGISYLEVYNENVHDLLNPAAGPLHLREDSVNGVIVAGMKVVQISDAEHLFELLRQGNANRTQHPTDANAESSRSHAVFQVFIKMQSKDVQKVQLVKLCMIDLAGSERGAATNCKGLRFKEGANINKSLLALGNCINNLADGVRHIPYRDSKLTRLLKDSLGGNCQTVMIACVGPTMHSYEDTYNTLRYAARASTIKTKLAKNVLPMDTHINHYKVLLQESQAKVSDWQAKCAEMEAKVAYMENELKNSGLRPSSEWLSPWFERLNGLYATKKSIYLELLSLESKEKLLRWRINYKHSNAVRVQAFDSEDEEFNRLENCASRMEGRLTGYHTRILELWNQKLDVDVRISAFREELETANLLDYLDAEMRVHEALIGQGEDKIQIDHVQKLLRLTDRTSENKDLIIAKMSEQYNQHHTILRGCNKVTNSMAGELKDIKILLKGNQSITWEASPTKYSDRLKKYSTLSLDLIHTDVSPCPLIPIDVDDEMPMVVETTTNINTQTEAGNADETFTVTLETAVPISAAPITARSAPSTVKKPIKSNRAPVHSPYHGVKKSAMKENKVSSTYKRPVSVFKKPPTPIFKTLKPLAPKNQNV